MQLFDLKLSFTTLRGLLAAALRRSTRRSAKRKFMRLRPPLQA
jgi:hypothetical protein